MTSTPPHSRPDPFTLAYIEALLFCTSIEADGVAYMVREGAAPSDYAADSNFRDAGFTWEDLDPASLGQVIDDCANFQAKYVRFFGEGPDRGSGQYSTSEQAGHDFYLTRHGHGAGFWDGDWPEPAATALTEASKSYGETWAILYCDDKGENGKIQGTP